MCASSILAAAFATPPPGGFVATVRRAGGGLAVTSSGERRRRDDPWAARVEAIAARQDREAFAALFTHFAPRVKTYLAKNSTSQPQAEEIAQEALLTVWRKAALYDARSASVSTWIFTIARNLRIDASRRERRGGAIHVDAVEAEFALDDAPLPDARMATVQSEAQVRAALLSLSSQQLKVIEMSFFEDKTHGEIARTLQIPLGTVKSRLRLAMNRLRGLLDDDA
jgi:RNA polymerase sigma-70 factor (ECF subfamily)